MIQELINRLQSIINKKDLDKLKLELADLQEKQSSPNFWNDQDLAKKTNQKISFLTKQIQTEDLMRELESLKDLEDLGIESGDIEIKNQVNLEILKYETIIDTLETETYLLGKFDSLGAIFTIHAGQGGNEACDWAAMLDRMYLKFFDKMGWSYEEIDRRDGTEAGIDSVSYEVSGSYVYGYLKGEHGTHRLVRVSPFNAQGLRQTSFAGVEVSPLFEEDDSTASDINIPESDISFEAVRSGGAGGQNVNKVATNVRITHTPTGIVVTCSTGRSQLANKKTAMQMLRGKLFQLEQLKKENELKGIKGDYKQASWGNQIRNYVLNPYKLVKDLRTDIESTDTVSVLDGDIWMFIEGMVKHA